MDSDLYLRVVRRYEFDLVRGGAVLAPEFDLLDGPVDLGGRDTDRVLLGEADVLGGNVLLLGLVLVLVLLLGLVLVLVLLLVLRFGLVLLSFVLLLGLVLFLVRLGVRDVVLCNRVIVVAEHGRSRVLRECQAAADNEQGECDDDCSKQPSIWFHRWFLHLIVSEPR